MSTQLSCTTDPSKSTGGLRCPSAASAAGATQPLTSATSASSQIYLGNPRGQEINHYVVLRKSMLLQKCDMSPRKTARRLLADLSKKLSGLWSKSNYSWRYDETNFLKVLCTIFLKDTNSKLFHWRQSETVLLFYKQRIITSSMCLVFTVYSIKLEGKNLVYSSGWNKSDFLVGVSLARKLKTDHFYSKTARMGAAAFVQTQTYVF